MAERNIKTSIRKRKISFAFAAILLLSVLFSVCYIALKAEHDCSGDECPVCVFLALCEQNIREYRFAILLLALFFLITPTIPLIHQSGTQCFRMETPVSLKVQLNN